MNKKILYLSMILLIGLSLLTGCGKNVEKKETSDISYFIGELVTLVDGSTWYVIENSDASSDIITLFASQNIKNDASGWTTTYDEYKIVFDEANARTTEKNSYCKVPNYGCNIYAAQSEIVTNGSKSGIVTEDSTIKKFLDGDVKTYINNSLKANGGTNINSIRLLTMDEYNAIKDDDLDGYMVSNSTDYWTMTPFDSDYFEVYYVNSYGVLHHSRARIIKGARPVIVTNKSNIK